MIFETRYTTVAFEVGTKVKKINGKPFKSGKKIGTVKEIVTHPQTNRHALVLDEDGSIVEACRCILADESGTKYG